MKKLLIFLLALSPSFLIAQGRLNLTNITRPASGPVISITPTTLSTFTTPTGTASSTQSITYTVSALTNTLSIAAVTGYEYSNNGGTSYVTSYSGLTVGGTLLVRIAAATSAGSYPGSIVFSSVGATSKSCSVSGTVNPVTPFLTTSLSTLPSLTTTVGNASSIDSFTVSGGNLTANATITYPTGFEGSLNKTTYTTSNTITRSGGALTGQPVWVYVRLASSTGVGTYSDTVKASSTSATTQNVLITGTVGSTSTKDSARFQFDTTTTVQSGWTSVKGDPNLHVISGLAGNSNTITWTTVSTSTNNWQTFGTRCISINGGTNGTVPNYAPNVMKEVAYNGNPANINFAYPQFIVGGLNPSSTYNISLSAGLGIYFSAIGVYQLQGISNSSVQSLNAYTNTSNFLSWSNIAPDASGFIRFYISPANAQDAGCISWIIIKEN